MTRISRWFSLSQLKRICFSSGDPTPHAAAEGDDVHRLFAQRALEHGQIGRRHDGPRLLGREIVFRGDHSADKIIVEFPVLGDVVLLPEAVVQNEGVIDRVDDADEVTALAGQTADDLFTALLFCDVLRVGDGLDAAGRGVLHHAERRADPDDGPGDAADWIVAHELPHTVFEELQEVDARQFSEKVLPQSGLDDHFRGGGKVLVRALAVEKMHHVRERTRAADKAVFGEIELIAADGVARIFCQLLAQAVVLLLGLLLHGDVLADAVGLDGGAVRVEDVCVGDALAAPLGAGTALVPDLAGGGLRAGFDAAVHVQKDTDTALVDEGDEGARHVFRDLRQTELPVAVLGEFVFRHDDAVIFDVVFPDNEMGLLNGGLVHLLHLAALVFGGDLLVHVDERGVVVAPAVALEGAAELVVDPVELSVLARDAVGYAALAPLPAAHLAEDVLKEAAVGLAEPAAGITALRGPVFRAAVVQLIESGIRVFEPQHAVLFRKQRNAAGNVAEDRVERAALERRYPVFVFRCHFDYRPSACALRRSAGGLCRTAPTLPALFVKISNFKGFVNCFWRINSKCMQRICLAGKKPRLAADAAAALVKPGGVCYNR